MPGCYENVLRKRWRRFERRYIIGGWWSIDAENGFGSLTQFLVPVVVSLLIYVLTQFNYVVQKYGVSLIRLRITSLVKGGYWWVCFDSDLIRTSYKIQASDSLSCTVALWGSCGTVTFLTFSCKHSIFFDLCNSGANWQNVTLFRVSDRVTGCYTSCSSKSHASCCSPARWTYSVCRRCWLRFSCQSRPTNTGDLHCPLRRPPSITYGRIATMTHPRCTSISCGSIEDVGKGNKTNVWGQLSLRIFVWKWSTSSHQKVNLSSNHFYVAMLARAPFPLFRHGGSVWLKVHHAVHVQPPVCQRWYAIPKG